MSCCFERFLVVKQKIFNKFSKYYTLFLFEHKYVFIFCYLLMLIAASFGLLQLRADESNQHLVYVTNSRALANRRHLEQLFVKRDYYFQHQLFDTGYYVEFMAMANERRPGHLSSHANLMSDEFNLINASYLSEFNLVYDQVVNLSVEDSKTNETFTYLNDLCPWRNQICAIEGSVLRTPSFQRKLLAHRVDYERDDPKEVHMDTESNDGSSLMFLFGNKYRKEKCEPQEPNQGQDDNDNDNDNNGGDEEEAKEAEKEVKDEEVKEEEAKEEEVKEEEAKSRRRRRDAAQQHLNCTKKNLIVHTAVFRVRFDLNVTGEASKKRALKFMDNFVQLMQNLTVDNKLTNLNVSFYASHTLEKEIAKYSGFEFHFVLYFWFAFLIMFTTFISLNLQLTHILNAFGSIVCC